ncbi:hypothetical protein OESDEN_04383 [Oesophagostomum dentatum]|uniref:Uncharacterized protein n=1 Tax=Oesophagostomum dentatum TaxID=61180 RepID=A0A0B1TJW6_OESDE|nr:hypothetical protein OESDEN_04383 [Oesophagostomum dentatum]
MGQSGIFVVGITARIDLHVKEKEAVEERADGYLRDICARDRDVILANKARDKAERKLNDTLYVANNAKCAHCQISDKMRKHLTDVVAEKTVLLEKCQKECIDAKKRAEQADRISQILSKDSEKLKFELSRWKSDAERNITEITRLKEELRRTSAPMFDKTMLNTSQPRGVRNPSPNDSVKASENTEEELLLRPPPAPPIMPTPPEEPDSLPASCTPKVIVVIPISFPQMRSLPLQERRPERSPPVSFFNSPSTTSRHGMLPSSLPRSHPFNGPLISNNSTSGRLNGPSSSPSNSDAANLARRNGEKMKGAISSKAAELLQVSADEDAGLQRRKTDQLCPHDTAPMIGKLPSRMCKKNVKVGSSSAKVQKTNATATQEVDEMPQSKIAPATPKVTGKPGKAKNKKKKLLGKQVPHTKVAPSLMSLHGPPPFNGPVSFFGSTSHAGKKPSEPHPAETMCVLKLFSGN